MTSELEQSELMDVLERAAAKLLAGQDLVQPDPEWIALVTGILELPIPAVKLALLQGRWRNAKNPKAYLQKVTRREAQRRNAARSEEYIENLSEHFRSTWATTFVRSVYRTSVV